MTARPLLIWLVASAAAVLPAIGLAGCTSGATPDCDGSSVCDPYETGAGEGGPDAGHEAPPESGAPESSVPETGAMPESSIPEASGGG